MQGQKVLTSLVLPQKDFEAGDEVAFDALRCLKSNNAIYSLTCLVAELQTSNQAGRVLERCFLS